MWTAKLGEKLAGEAAGLYHYQSLVVVVLRQVSWQWLDTFAILSWFVVRWYPSWILVPFVGEGLQYFLLKVLRSLWD